MKTNDTGPSIVAQGAEEWRKRCLEAEDKQRLLDERSRITHEEFVQHNKIMGLIQSIGPSWEFTEYVEETYYPYCTLAYHKCNMVYPTEELLSRVMERGNHEEIMALIGKYEHKQYYSGSNTDYYEPAPELVMPLNLSDYIIGRGNREEIGALCKKHGVGASGQDILLERGDHEELVWYLGRHGFLANQQRKLIERGNVDEIRQHIKHHALAPELLDELVDEVKAGKTENFYKFIAIRDIPSIKHQRALLEVMKLKEFCAYIEHHGFWEVVLRDLVRLRSDVEIMSYIGLHHYLGDGVYELLKHSRPLIKFYMTEQPKVDWIAVLTSVKKLDYELLTKVFSQVTPSGSFSDDEKVLVELLRNGSHEDVMVYLKSVEELKLSKVLLAELFFRNEPEEFEYYLDNHLYKRGGRKDN